MNGRGTLATLMYGLVFLFVATVYAICIIVRLIGEGIVYLIGKKSERRAEAKTIQAPTNYCGEHRR